MVEPGSRPGDKGSVSSWEAAVKQAGTDAANANQQPVWVSGSRGNKNMMTLEQIQQGIYSQASGRSTAYNDLVENLYQGNFISKAQMDQPASVVAAMQYPINMYQGYLSRAGNDAKPYGEWFDWYSKGNKPRSEGGGGGYTGPTSSVTLANEYDLREAANAVASTVLGRGIEDSEFEEVLKKIRKQEKAQPTISTPSTGKNVTKAGLTAEGRQNIMRDSLMKGPEAEEYSKATKMMGVFAKALEMRPDGS